MVENLNQRLANMADKQAASDIFKICVALIDFANNVAASANAAQTNMATVQTAINTLIAAGSQAPLSMSSTSIGSINLEYRD